MIQDDVLDMEFEKTCDEIGDISLGFVSVYGEICECQQVNDTLALKKIIQLGREDLLLKDDVFLLKITDEKKKQLLNT